MANGSDDPGGTITRMVGEVDRLEGQAKQMKLAVNAVCLLYDRPMIYTDIESAARKGLAGIGKDQFYGVPQATAVRAYLQMRGDTKAGGQGAASVNEIYDALQSGGFKFEVKNDENAKRGLRISLAKNAAAFHKLPNGTFGLSEWYPNARAPRVADEAPAEPSAGDAMVILSHDGDGVVETVVAPNPKRQGIVLKIAKKESGGA